MNNIKKIKEKYPDPKEAFRKAQAKAMYQVMCAIRKGTLKRTNCEKCESSIRIHAHHDDYNRPLDVRFLCIKCHADFHRKHKAIYDKLNYEPIKMSTFIVHRYLRK
jgi:hypothetical protein